MKSLSKTLELEIM